MIKEIKLPEIADNVTTAIVLEILVSAGDKVNEDDALIEMESDKATFEVPADFSGTIKDVLVKEGDEVKVGQAMITIDTSGSTDTQEVEEEESGQVGSQVEETENEPETSEEQIADVEDKPVPPSADQPDNQAAIPASSIAVPAPPSVRRLAREIGVDIVKVSGTGPNGRITASDVKDFAKKSFTSKAVSVSDDYELPDFSKWGPVRREKMDNIRKITASTMAESWQNIPHVFQFDKADVTGLEKFRKKYSKEVDKRGGKLTLTAMLLKVTAEALKKFPRFNASIDMKNQEIIYKDYINIGVAVDTDRGLLVPVIRDADKKSITSLSVELGEIAEKARKKKIMPDELQGGNFAVSNLGGIGGTNFTPIVYRPNVAILGVSRSQTEPVFIDGEFKPRTMLPLSLSYDHRIIDGADGASFVWWICEALENPMLTMF